MHKFNLLQQEKPKGFLEKYADIMATVMIVVICLYFLWILFQPIW